MLPQVGLARRDRRRGSSTPEASAEISANMARTANAIASTSRESVAGGASPPLSPLSVKRSIELGERRLEPRGCSTQL